MKITFCGGATEVTGANYLLEKDNIKLLVDCGLHQGKSGEEKNISPFYYKPTQISALFVTHAHIDHIGLIPRLFKEGFRGKIFSTHPTKELSLPMLVDALKVMRSQYERNKKYILYDEEDIDGVMKLWVGVDYHEKIKIEDLEVELISAGHILGSSSILFSVNGGEKKIAFSGDIGDKETVFVKPLEYIKEADFVIMESTYGGRHHQDKSRRKDILFRYVLETIRQRRTLVIPAFALERTQELIYDLNEIIENKLKEKEKISVFIDGWLISQILAVYKKYANSLMYFSKEAVRLQKIDDIFNFRGLSVVDDDRSRELVLNSPTPKIIIAASGMSTGGRVMFYEARYLEDPSATFLIVGYQAPETLGRKLLDGEKTVFILGKKINVRARICFTDAYSAHADQDGLLKWLLNFNVERIKKVFLVQGDKEESLSLANAIKQRVMLNIGLPKEGESVIL